MALSMFLRSSALTLLACAASVSRSSCGQPGSGSHAALWIEIVSPSSSGLFTTDLTAIGIGGNVGGWTIFDPAPAITWRNVEAGTSGSVGQLIGTFDTGQLALVLGPNTIHVKAANGAQKSATATIVVTRVVP